MLDTVETRFPKITEEGLDDLRKRIGVAIGVILVSYPGAADFIVKPGSLGKPIPGGRVEVHDAEGRQCAPEVPVIGGDAAVSVEAPLSGHERRAARLRSRQTASLALA